MSGLQSDTRCHLLGAIAAGVAVALAFVAPARGQPSVALDQSVTIGPVRTGKQIFESNCTTCHGLDGRGAKPETTGLEIPLPDFTDCAFTSREAERDWVGIVHQGGPVRAFDERMPAFGGVLSQHEIELAVRHVKRFCTEVSWPPGDLNLPRAILTEKAFPENELLLITAVALEGQLDVSGKLIYEQRFGARSQFEVIAPFGVFRRSAADSGSTGRSRWGRGLGDVAFGFKHVVYHHVASGTIASLGAEFVIPTGSAAEGIGKDTYGLEPFMTVGQSLSELGFVQLHAGLGLPFDESRAEKELFCRFALGRMFTYGRFGRFWVPMFELESVRELGANGKTTWSYLPQVQVALSKRKHVRANLGVMMPLNDLTARPMQAMAYLLWDWYDGGLDEGW